MTSRSARGIETARETLQLFALAALSSLSQIQVGGDWVERKCGVPACWR
jgi:hypothetical protein